MGRYVTTTSISVLMPSFLTGNTTASDTAGVDIFSNATDYAEGEVNGAMVSRYDPSSWTTTGNPGIPPLVRGIAADLTCYYAIRNAGVQDSQVKNLSLDTYGMVLEKLEKLRNGKLPLAYTDGSLVPTRSAARMLSSTENYTQIFGLDTESSWVRDSDEIDDQSTARE